jgi:hypothetical protein
MEQSTFYETSSRSANQQIPCLLWKVHYNVHNSPLFVIINI